MARYCVGHTGITWPSDLDGVTRAVADVAALSYEGFETFGATIERFAAERPPGLGPVLERHGLPLVSAYCWGSFVDPAAREEDIAQNLRWARMAKNLGASVITLGATRRPKEQYRPDEYHAMAATLSDLGRR